MSGLLAVGLLGAGTAPASADTPTVVAGNWSEPGAPSFATCPKGTKLIGGGYDARPRHEGLPDGVRDAVGTNAPSLEKPNSWAARMQHGSVRAYALCDKDE